MIRKLNDFFFIIEDMENPDSLKEGFMLYSMVLVFLPLVVLLKLITLI